MKRDLESYVRTIPDFPEKGIMFRDVTTVLQDKDGFQMAVDAMQKELEDVEFDAVLATESRGFIFGAPLAYNMHKAFVPVRKKGKLPAETISMEYELEYGTAELELHMEKLQKQYKL